MASTPCMNEHSSGTELALEDLRWLKALASRLVRDPHMADDAVQETLLVAFEQRPRARGSLRAWLRTVLRNALLKEWRGRARRARREELVGSPHDERSTLEVVEELALHRGLVERVQALEEPYRTVIVLHYLRGHDVAQVARDLGVPVKTVHTRLRRALHQLRQRLGPDREAWAALLLPTIPHTLPPAIPALLLPMYLKSVAALLAICLLCALVYLRSSSSHQEQTAVQQAPSVIAAMPVSGSGVDAPVVMKERESVPLMATTPVAPSATSSDLLEVHGFVRTLDGRGLGDVEVAFEAGRRGVFAEPSEAHRAHSGREGAFVLTCPRIGGRLNLRSDEYVGVALPQLEGDMPLSVPIVVAAPSRKYSGVVLDESRTPIARAHAEITLDGSFVQSRDVGGQSVHLLLPFVETACDEAGRFQFEHAGFMSDALLEVSADGYVEKRLALPQLSSANLEIVLVRKPTGPRTICGLVLDANEAIVPGAFVSLGGATVQTAADGRFRLECEAWRKGGWIRAFRSGSLPAELALDQALTASTPEKPLVLHLGAQPRSIEGTLLDAEGKPVVGARVWTPDTTPFGDVDMQEGERSFRGGTTVEALLTGNTDPWASQVTTKTDAQGKFALGGLMEREYALFALDAHALEGLGPVAVWSGSKSVVLRLGHAPCTKVAGRVVSRSGVPLSGVSVTPGRHFGWRASDGTGASRWTGFPIVSPFAAQTIRENAVITDGEGRFELAPLVTQGVFLAMQGKSLVLSDSFELDNATHLDALEIAVDASSRFRVSLAHVAEADAFRLEEGDGSHVPLYIELEGVTISAPNASIEHGQSGVVLTSEGDHVLVLLAGKDEVRRVPTHFTAGGLIELHP